MRRVLALFALGISSSVVAAQQSGGSGGTDAAAVRSTLARAIKSYEEFQVELAVKQLDSALMRHDLLTPAEAAKAHKYLGAGSAVLGKAETAAHHYFQALKLDATTDLDPAKFSASERGPFEVARQRWQADVPSASQVAPAPTDQVGTIRIGSTRTDAFFYVNDAVQGPVSVVRLWSVPAGRPIRITIRAVKCSVPWDTTLMVRAGSQITIGRRSPTGCAP